MSVFQLTTKAKSDLKDIALFTENQWGVTQRNIYLKQFDDIFHILAKDPLTGMNCDYIKEGYRKFPQGSHIIFYKILKSKHILILRILHKRMDVNSNL